MAQTRLSQRLQSQHGLAAWPLRIRSFSRKKPGGALGALVLVVMGLAALFAPLVATHDPLVQDIPNRLHAPGLAFYFGTDEFGRDLFSRVVFGARTSLFVGFGSVALGAVVGTTLGPFSAYVGGRIDLGIQRFIDALQGIPGLVLALAMVVALGASLSNVTIAIGVALLPAVVRIARAQALVVKEEDYVLAARALGASTSRIIFFHILPNSLAPIIVLSTGFLGTAIVIEASLSFLGLGVPPPNPSWGGILQFGARQFQQAAPWLTIFPGLALAIAVFAFNFLGDALRDVMDPRLRR